MAAVARYELPVPLGLRCRLCGRYPFRQPVGEGGGPVNALEDPAQGVHSSLLRPSSCPVQCLDKGVIPGDEGLAIRFDLHQMPYSVEYPLLLGRAGSLNKTTGQALATGGDVGPGTGGETGENVGQLSVAGLGPGRSRFGRAGTAWLFGKNR